MAFKLVFAKDARVQRKHGNASFRALGEQRNQCDSHVARRGERHCKASEAFPLEQRLWIGGPLKSPP